MICSMPSGGGPIKRIRLQYKTKKVEEAAVKELNKKMNSRVGVH